MRGVIILSFMKICAICYFKYINFIKKKFLFRFLSDFNVAMQKLAHPIVDAAVSLYDRVAKELLPTPAKSHYVFNLRDLSKCIQGVLQADSSNYTQPTQILRLFYHESMRVFHDRLINSIDKEYFKNLMKEICLKYVNILWF